MKHKPNADDVRRIALAALASALEDRKEEAKKKPGLTGVRAVATGAVIYTAGRAVFSGRRFVRDHMGSDGDASKRDDDEYEDPDAEEDDQYEDEDYDEPRAEEDEEPEDDEYEDEDEEPRAEEDEEPEDDEYEDEEPRAEEDEDEDDYGESEPEEERRRPPSRRPPAHAKRDPDEVPDVELPSRPSRSRAPVGRA
jgi:hypothetical protein